MTCSPPNCSNCAECDDCMKCCKAAKHNIVYCWFHCSTGNCNMSAKYNATTNSIKYYFLMFLILILIIIMLYIFM